MIKRIAIAFISFYKAFFSPVLTGLGAGCRFHPTCSQYAIDAFHQKGALEATALTFKRILKCGPWHPGGLDEVPN